ncbi:CCR4-NOT transcription complex subunit 4-like [Oncorhynchus mykiss]|uniref:CCR4-NOT transcription complex subunit 4-like n=1 Tax=Oncorhynchus mykiss TaxID=8022 RepID=UPI001877A629|nr:CCR4-NOT transcription complex subunit 4-like [Oncorhynchus mykiss]
MDPMECPLCLEPLETDDANFFPCTCGYQICRFCWHRIRTDENGLCPACRKPYPENPAVYNPLSAEELQRIKNEKKAKQVEKKQKTTENRKHLASVRVVQRNLVFLVGLSQRLADPEILKRPEYFVKFGKVHKVVINNSTSYAGSQGPSASAYVTYIRSEDALRAIQCVNNLVVDGRTLKASLGTTKYCSYFLKSMGCPKPDCMYLHELGDDAASFTKEEMQAGKHQEYEQRLLQDLYQNPSFTTQTSGGETTKSSKPSCLQRSNSNNSHGQEAWPALQPTGKTTNGLSEHSKSPPSNGGGLDSEHVTPDGPERDVGLGSVTGLSPFSSSRDPPSPRDALPDVTRSRDTQHGDSSERHNLLPDSDSPSPPPVLSGPPGFSKASQVVPISVTTRSPFQGADAESQSLFSDNSNYRHPNPVPSSLRGFTSSSTHNDTWPTAPQPHSLFTSDSIPVSSSTDWQAAFGFGSSKQQTSEDDLGFDPFDITRKALEDLIEKELSVQDSLPSLSISPGPFPPHHHHSLLSSVATKAAPGPPGELIPRNHFFSGPISGLSSNHCFSQMHQHHPQQRAVYNSFSFPGQPPSSSSSSSSSSSQTSRHPWMTSAPNRNNFMTHFGGNRTVSQHSSFLDLMLPSAGLGGIATTGFPSSAGNSFDSQDDNPPHWLKSLQALTEMDAPSIPSSTVNPNPQQPNSHSGQVRPHHRPSWAPFPPPSTASHNPHPVGHFHSPPPGFQTAFRSPAQTPTELLQSAGMDRH